jgi:hypothetical protein
VQRAHGHAAGQLATSCGISGDALVQRTLARARSLGNRLDSVISHVGVLQALGTNANARPGASLLWGQCRLKNGGTLDGRGH